MNAPMEADAVTVRLTPSELMIAANCGCMRHIAAVKKGARDMHGAQEGGWQLHIEGALGELAAAKCMGVFWNASINTFKLPDLGGNIQVRTRSRHDYELIVREDDMDNDRFILVTGVAPEYRVHGWILARDAKNPEWIKDHGGRAPAYFVPKAALRPLNTLQVR